MNHGALGGFGMLLDADGHDLWLVVVLNRNVDWHGVLPLPYFLFFHCDPQLCATGPRIVNIIGGSRNRLFRDRDEDGLYTLFELVFEIALNEAVFQTMKADHRDPSALI